MDDLTKRVLSIPKDEPFDEDCYYYYRIWMLFRESKEREHDIERVFHQLRGKKKKVINLKKKGELGKFVVPCIVASHSNPNALYGMRSSVSTKPRAMVNQLGLKIKTSRDSFTFVDFSKVDLGEIVRDLQVENRDHVVHVDLYVIDIQIEWNTSLLLGRAFMTIA